MKNISLGVLLLSGLITLFSFAATRRAECSGHSAEIRLASQSGNYFINTSCIEDIIRENTGVYEGQAINKVTLKELHGMLNKIAFAKNVKTYRTVTGKLGVEMDLRNPIIRLINKENESFYVDEKGYVFPLSELHTARVMIATGNIPAVFSAGNNISSAPTDSDDLNAKAMAGLFELASFIHGDAFWNAFIDQIFVLPNGKLELIPKNGYHVIEFGYPEHIVEKFSKLRVFYIHGLPKKGWHHYSTINLEYNNQIICSK